MKQSLLSSLLIVFLLLFSFVENGFSGPLPSTKAGSLFSEVPQKFDGLRANDKTIKRKRFVNVAFGTMERPTHLPGQISLNLFEDTQFTAVFDRVEKNLHTGFAWIGHLEGIEHSQVVLVIGDGMLTGSVSFPGKNYQVRGLGGALHVVEEMDHSQFPPESEPLLSPDPLMQHDVVGLEMSGDASCEDITVLVAYTPEARVVAGGTTQIENKIALAVTETNQSYINSGVNARIRLVHTMETAPGDAANNFSLDLARIRVVGDGYYNDVDAAREAYYADEVALIINNSASCGLGYLNSTAASAFTVTHLSCATGYYSFGHEIGHNMGAHHDWYVEDNYSYQKAYVNRPDRWRTVMGYNRACSDKGFNCNRIQYWSNPDVSYEGDSTGVASAGPVNCVEGSYSPDPSSCAADNRTKLNSTCTTVANFRTSPATIADLLVTSPAVDKGALVTGETYSFEATVENSGNGSADPTTLRYYISPNATISVDDRPLGSDSIVTLVAAGISLQSVSLYAPSSAGTYYVGACVDEVDGEVETGNNCSSGVAITVTGPPIPDLAVIRLTVEDISLYPEQTYGISMVIENQGNDLAEATTLRYYRSPDGEITEEDKEIATAGLGSLLVGGKSLENISFSAASEEGTYWVGACVDKVANEGNISNNCSTGVRIKVDNAFPWYLFRPAIRP